ncbi:response regulator [Achromobacter sp. SD115]|uniref:hybrid sensor histidine kinase/response regulator n=1 Tax=Achromobacter sp. SD115 TaxID=2782011 RepID=UPI001A97752D|nr:hybrid sensor histidine kinase/response regulator [Achromobacter sp. SD115]MBO1014512.1 response regulator [Achromobacter sp. SD115]
MLITAAVLLTFGLEAKSTADKHLEYVRQSFMAEHAVLMREIHTRENAFLIALAGAELMWREAGSFDAEQIQKYRSQGEELLLESDQDSRSRWILGSGSGRVANTAIGKFLGVAEQIGRMPSGAAAVRERAAASFFFGVNGSIAGIVPAPEEAIRDRILVDRDRYLALLTGEISRRMLIATDAGTDTWRALRWIPPSANPITGKQVLRIGGTILEKGVPVAVLVSEYPPLRPGASQAANRLAGDFAIMSAGGQLIAAMQEPESDAIQNATSAADLAVFPAGARQERTRSGQFSISEGLGHTGWMLVFTMDWSSIVAAIGAQLTTATATTAATLALIWALLLYFELRVVRPLMDRSRLALESEHLNRTLIETAPVGLGLIDAASGSPLLHSPTMEKMTSRVGAGKFSLSAELANRYRRRAGEAAGKRDTDVIEEELSFVARDGHPITLSVSMAGARYRGSNVVVAAFIDVTEKYLLAQRLREAKAAADRGNAAKSAFLAAMSHEIRTPLHAILGHLELLSRSALAPAQRTRLETVRASSGLLLATISDVLDFSKIEAGELSLERTEFDLTEIASRALSMFAPQAQAKGLDLLGDLGSALQIPMQGDATRLEQVIHNLLSNAIKFTDQGKVVLRVRTDSAGIAIEVEDTGIGMTEEQTQSVFRAFSQGDATIGRRYGGTGLGLTLCCRLVDAMGGSLSVRSEPGGGSLFAFTLQPGIDASENDRPWFAGEQVLLLAARDNCRHHLETVLRTWGLRVHARRHPSELDADALNEATVLIIWGNKADWHPQDEDRLLDQSSWVIDCGMLGPATPQDTGRKLSVSMYRLQGLAWALRHALQDTPLATATPAAAPAPPHPGRSLRVLVAEDNAANRGLFEEQFKLLGCEVDLAEGGAQACALLASRRYDVLVTDLAMPGMDGYALARQARSIRPDMPVIAATACVTEHERQRSAEAGIALVLTKPLPLAELELALLDVCGQAAPGLQRSTTTSGGPQALTGGRAFPPALLRTFEQSCAQSLDTIKRAARDEDSDSLRGELHALRGMLAIFRLPALAAQCAQLDARLNQLAVRGSAEAVSGICDDVLAAVKNAVETADGQRPTEQA